MRFLRLGIFSLLIITIVGVSFGMGFGLGQSAITSAGAARTPIQKSDIRSLIAEPNEFKLLGEVWDILVSDFVDAKTISKEQLGRGAIEGMIQALNDAHTSYIDPDSYSRERLGFQGSYEGIGAHVAIQDQQLTIITPIPGSPAEIAGIKPGDIILAINGDATDSLSLTDAVRKIKGPSGSTVILSVLHLAEGAPVTLRIKREQIKTPSVIVENLPDNLARLRILYFSQRTDTEVEEALKQLHSQGVKGIVIDLRNNPGGLLSTTINVTSQFVKGGVIAIQVDKDGRQELLNSKPGGLEPDIPLAVLVNGNSASGSEIMAGALQDYGRGPIIGTKSFGKGSVNHLRELSDGSAVYVTVARWLTPNGRQIEGEGLSPDIEVTVTTEQILQGMDPQLQTATEYLTKGHS
ncbi:MAG: S41 family peptidase [Dehalococcoidia bacterium]|nr:S41 family peptidase [Dehalococcoidia bacterium]